MDYMCRYQSLHRVRFHADAGKLYRLHSSRVAPGRFVITAYKVRDPNLPDADGVPTESEQLNTRRLCGFSECARELF